jgi:hypothetical protein
MQRDDAYLYYNPNSKLNIYTVFLFFKYKIKNKTEFTKYSILSDLVIDKYNTYFKSNKLINYLI